MDIDSPDWIKKKKATINPKNEDDELFYTQQLLNLNYENIECNPETVSNIKPLINKYNCEKINYYVKKFEKKRSTIDFNIFYTKEKNFLLIF